MITELRLNLSETYIVYVFQPGTKKRDFDSRWGKTKVGAIPDFFVVSRLRLRKRFKMKAKK
jgi:hypothetical protein